MTDEELDALAAKCVQRQSRAQESTLRRVVSTTRAKTDWRSWITFAIAVAAFLGTLGFSMFTSRAEYDTHVKLVAQEQVGLMEKVAKADSERSELKAAVNALTNELVKFRTLIEERLPPRR